MPRERRRFWNGLVAVAAGAGLCGPPGCEPAAPQTHPVRGRVRFDGGDVRQLAGGHVEAVPVGDLSAQAAGEIRDDGSFVLETIHAGKPLPGARAGEYQARVVLTDEDAGGKRRKGFALPKRYAQYPSSGLTFRVPTAGDIQLAVSAK